MSSDSSENARFATSPESIRQLYLAERQRRESIRSQLSIPVSIVSFSIFGFVSFSQYFDADEWREPVTFAMLVLIAASLIFLLSAMVFLARVEWKFMAIEMHDLEDLQAAEDEHDYFNRAYLEARKHNARAAHHRARAFLLMLVALACFIAAVAFMPLHLADTNVHGRSGGPPTSQSQNWQSGMLHPRTQSIAASRRGALPLLLPRRLWA